MQKSETPGKDFKAAYRAVHNLYSQYQGLGELREALKTTLNLDQHIKNEEARLLKAREVTAKMVEQLETQEQRLKGIGEEYKQKASQLENSVQVEIKKLRDARTKEHENLQDFLQENQIRINQIKAETSEAEKVLENRKSEIALEIEVLESDRRSAEKALSTVHKKMEKILGGIDG